MQWRVDLQAWRNDGKRFWNEVQEKEFAVIFWNNPWFRLAGVAALLLTIAGLIALAGRASFLSLLCSLIALPFIYMAIKFRYIGWKTGGLYSFFTKTGFGIGCDADRILIPYASIAVPQTVSLSTVNSNYIVLPVRADVSGIIIERKVGESSPWDGKPYARGIASILIKNGVLIAKASPNEMIVQLFCVIYPLSLYLASKDEPQPAANSSG